MRLKKIKIISISGKDIAKSLLAKNIIGIPEEIEFIGVSFNDKSLASIYNKYLTPEYADDILIFVHDDVYISDGDFKRKCYAAIKDYDVFGVAGGFGGLEIEPNKPALWHLITRKFAGYVGHYEQDYENNDNPFMSGWMTNFGKTPQEVTLIDGVFLGINVEKVLEKGIKFDEACPSRFHFYDLLFCINAKKAGLKLGVFPFNVFHRSHGLREFNQEFLDGDRYFKSYCSLLSKK